MWSTSRSITFISLLIQFLCTVHCAPVIVGHVKDSKHKQKIIKTDSKSENAQKKSDLNKKTSVSINGQFLPMAQLSSSDKNIHVTVQKANPTVQQVQPTIQEVSLQGQNVVTPNVAQIPVVQPSTAQATNNLGTNTIGLSPGVISTNPNPVVGMSPGIVTTNPNPVVGMSPGIVTTNPNPVVATSPAITTNTGHQVLGITPSVSNQMLLVKNPDGQLSYKPVVTG